MNLKRKSVLIFIILILISFKTPNNMIETNLNIPIKMDCDEDFKVQVQDTKVKQDFSMNYEEFGNQEVFWTYNFLKETNYQINTTLLAVGTWCYIYVENTTIEQDGIDLWIKNCNFYRDEFDSTIYPKAVEFAGSPDGTMGDIDGDPHVTILFSPIQGATGYYAHVNEMPIFYYSNNREMIVIDTRINLFEVMITLPHEFNHLIWGNNEEEDAIFLMEGGAEYATYFTGYLANSSYLIAGQDYNLTDLTPFFQTNPQLSLLCFDRENDDTRVHYGSSYMFFFYFAEKYGLEAAQQLIHTEADGVQAIELVLTNLGYNVSFNDVYLDWITACTLDLEGVENNLYSFDNANFTINNYYEVLDTRYHETNALYKYYGFQVKKLLEPSNKFTLQISSPRDPYGMGIVVAIHDKNGWNITQSLVFAEDDMFSYFCSGDDIDYAYVITSLMKESPMAPLISYPAPTDYINFAIVEGHVPIDLSTEESGMTIFPTFFIIISVFISVYNNKKTRN